MFTRLLVIGCVALFATSAMAEREFARGHYITNVSEAGQEKFTVSFRIKVPREPDFKGVNLVDCGAKTVTVIESQTQEKGYKVSILPNPNPNPPHAEMAEHRMFEAVCDAKGQPTR